MPTIGSGLSAYATLQDLANRFDIRPIRQLVSDVGVPLDPAGNMVAGEVNALLMEASGWVEAAASAGARYEITPTRNDLLTIYQSGTNTAEMLKGLVCAITYWMIWERRPEWLGGNPGELPSRVKIALQKLEDLNQGHIVFGLVESEEAGDMSDYTETAQDVQNRHGITVTARPLFGPRNNQLHG